MRSPSTRQAAHRIDDWSTKPERDMSDTTQGKTAGLLKNKPLIFLVATFAVLIAVGIFTS